MAHADPDRMRSSKPVRPEPNPLEFAVEAWSRDRGSLEQVLSRCNNLLIARAAFDRPCLLHPARHITLRHGCRLIQEQSASR